MLEKGRARLRERGWRQRDEQSDEKREMEIERKQERDRERTREREREEIRRKGGCEGGKTADGIGGAKLLGGGLIKPS